MVAVHQVRQHQGRVILAKRDGRLLAYHVDPGIDPHGRYRRGNWTFLRYREDSSPQGAA